MKWGTSAIQDKEDRKRRTGKTGREKGRGKGQGEGGTERTKKEVRIL